MAKRAGSRAIPDLTEALSTPGGRIKASRVAAKLSISELARRVGVSRSAASQWEADATVPAAENLRQIAYVCNVSFEFLATGRGKAGLPEEAPARIEVVGIAEANVWRPRESYREHPGRELSYLPTDPRYPSDSQFDLLIKGASINRFAKDGDYVRAVKIDKLAWGPPNNSYVVVVRIKHDVAETTVKQLRTVEGTLELWTDSTDPELNESWEINAGEIVGVVLYAYRPGLVEDLRRSNRDYL